MNLIECARCKKWNLAEAMIVDAALRPACRLVCSADAPHPWTLHDPGETGAPPRVTDDNGDEVTLQRAWREVQILRAILRPFAADWIEEYADAARRVGAQMISPPLELAVWAAARATLDSESPDEGGT